MRFFKFAVLVFSLTFLISASCKNQTSAEHVSNKPEQEQKKKNKEYNPKNLKLLSEFIDTLLLNRFYPEIKKFENKDSLNGNRNFDIVFVGSSSIRKWKSLEHDMKGLTVLNRGFGGSTVPEAIFYANTLFFKHKPKKIIFYSGDNDVAILKTSVNKIIGSYIYLYELLSQKMPNTDIFILSIKPSPGRWKFWPQMKEVNIALKDFCNKNTNCEFIDVSSDLIDTNGILKEELFKNDRIHLNEKGYGIWTEIILPEIK